LVLEPVGKHCGFSDRRRIADPRVELTVSMQRRWGRLQVEHEFDLAEELLIQLQLS
jgi:hypothetical protein